MSFEVESECACCGQAIHFTMHSDSSYALHEQCAQAKPIFFVPMVDFTRLKEPSIVDVF